MNTLTTIIVVSALAVGLAAGTVISRNTEAVGSAYVDVAQVPNQVVAEDFLSVRPAISTLAVEHLSEDEVADILYMREEEKLARDVYQTLYETWNLPIFSNIAQSEQTHTEAVRTLIEKYALTDPVTDDSVGVFTNTTLQELYTSLVERGKKSTIEALMVGATIEDLDIKDLQEALGRTDNVDSTLVYENLTRGSRNHLRAFNRQLVQQGVTYAPQYITPNMFTSIIEGQTETGRGGGGGWGGRR
jgi:hypothetical protein